MRFGVRAFTFVVFFAAGFAQAQTVTLPDTAPGKALAGWLKVCEAADPAAIAKWSSENLSEATAVRIGGRENWNRRRTRDCAVNRGYRVVSVEDSQADKMAAIGVSNATGTYVTLNIALEGDGKVRGMPIRPADIPDAAMPKTLDDASIEKALREYVDRLAAAEQFSGIVVVARGDQPFVTYSKGFADREKKGPVTLASQFTLGSMSKMWTAASIGQLVDAGKVSFSDTVGKFFPDFANKTVRDKVTVGMLLSHTSGMGDFLGKRTPKMMKDGVTRADEFLPLYAGDEPKFEPGKDWAYSNAGLALAGAIVEKVSGVPFPEYVRKNILERAGMKNSDPNNVPQVFPQQVVAYTESEQGGWERAERDIGSPAGGAVSTAQDLLRFAEALRSGELVSKKTLEELMTAHAKTPFGGSYGYGMQVEEKRGRKVVGHGGGFPGVSTQFAMIADTPYTVVVLANQDPPAADVVTNMATAILVKRVSKN